MGEEKNNVEVNFIGVGKESVSMRRVFSKIVAISILPLLCMGLTICGISIFKYTDLVEEEIRDELRMTAYGVCDNYNYLDDGDYSEGENGEIKKGDTVVSGKLTQMQAEIIRNGLVCTFFYGDERIDTSVVDVSGANMAGTRMNEEVYNSIYISGKEIFIDNLELGGRKYYGYYIPVFNSDGTAKACFFAGKLRSDVMGRINEIASLMGWVGLIVILIGIIISAFLAIYLVNSLYKKFGEDKEMSIKKEVGKVQEDFLTLVGREIRGSMDDIIILDEKLLAEDPAPIIRDKALGIKDITNEMIIAYNSVHDYSKLESETTVIEKRPYEVKELLESCKRNIIAGIERKKLGFEIEIAEDVPSFLRGDAAKLKQILNNLLINSVKYTYEGQVKISVMSRRITPDVVDLSFTVKDTGIGIRSEDIDNLFTSFGKTGNSKSVAIKGTGLGLLTCKKLVNLMDGRISVESDMGNGTTFKVTLPQEVIEN